MSFRFAVTWSALLVPVDAPHAPSGVVSMNDRPRPVSKPSKSTEGAESLVPPPARTVPMGPVQWEMVVPKMVRPARRAAGVIAAPALARRPPQLTGSEDPEPAVPGLLSPALQSSTPWLRKVLGASLLVAIAATALIGTLSKRRTASAEVEADMGGAGWVRNVTEAGDPGAKQSRHLLLYRPSLSATDGRLEFEWAVDSTGVGWVFRAKDLGNYYAMRLKVLKPGPSPSLSLERFSVYQWVESAHEERVLVFSREDPVIRVRTEVAGPTFTVYLQGNASDYWTDGRLTSGGFGFFEEWYRGADIRAVRMSFPEQTKVPQALPGRETGRFFALLAGPGGN